MNVFWLVAECVLAIAVVVIGAVVLGAMMDYRAHARERRKWRELLK